MYILWQEGSVVEVCCKRLAKTRMEVITTKTKDQINCNGCGAPGVCRSRCETCKNKDTPPKPVAFYTIETTMKNHFKIPTIELIINGENGYAHIDTVSRTSTAGTQLYRSLI